VAAQDPRSLFQLVDGGDEPLTVMAERFEADHGAWASTLQLEMVERKRATRGPATERQCDARAVGGGGRTRGRVAWPREALV
jgi:hypothetical protein